MNNPAGSLRMSGMSVEAIVKADLLIWARESAAYSVAEAAKKIDVATKKLQSWESGASKPTIIQLRKIAEVYKRPIAVFYLQAPPKDVAVLRDFRHLPGVRRQSYTPELLFEMRRAQNRRKFAIELFQTLEGEVPVPLWPGIRTTDKTESAASASSRFPSGLC